MAKICIQESIAGTFSFSRIDTPDPLPLSIIFHYFIRVLLHFYASLVFCANGIQEISMLGSSVQMEFKRKHVSSATLVMFEETEV